jgi:hypothetical protein
MFSPARSQGMARDRAQLRQHVLVFESVIAAMSTTTNTLMTGSLSRGMNRKDPKRDENAVRLADLTGPRSSVRRL